MRCLIGLLLLMSAGRVVAQPVNITFTGGSEFGTEMEKLTADYVITTHGPYHFRKIKKMAFTVSLPDSASVQRLQSKAIDVYLKSRLVGLIVLKPMVKPTETRISDSTKAVNTGSRNTGAPVTIVFMVGSEIRTEMTGYNDGYVTTDHGPYSYLDIQKMTFTAVLPDSATILRLQSKNIDVYFKSKRVAQLFPTPIIVSQPVIPTNDTTKTPAPNSRGSGPVTAYRVMPEQEYNASFGTGFGIGLDYGGIGLKLTVDPTSEFSIFGALGYNFAGLGYNAGLEFNFAPHSKTTAFLSAMYGYNAVLLYPAGSSVPSEIFYGPSIGFGIKSWSSNGENFFTFQLIYPFRDAAFMNAPTQEKPWPVLFSVGFGFGR